MNKIITLIFSIFISLTTFGQVGLKINEVDYDQLSLDSAEFLELYNADANAIDLGGYSVLLVNGNNNTPYDTIALPTHMLNPGSFYVICGNGGFVPMCDLVLPVYSNIIQNGAPDAIAIVDNQTSNVIDALSYEGAVAAPYVEGTTGFLVGDTVVTTPMLGIGRYPDGMDTNDNAADFHNACSTPGTANVNVNTNCSTGIQPMTSLVNSIRVFPNPSKGISTIDCRGLKNARITIKNVIGNEIRTAILNSQESMYTCDLSQFPNGVYFVQIKSDSVEYTQRIILKK